MSDCAHGITEKTVKQLKNMPVVDVWRASFMELIASWEVQKATISDLLAQVKNYRKTDTCLERGT